MLNDYDDCNENGENNTNGYNNGSLEYYDYYDMTNGSLEYDIAITNRSNNGSLEYYDYYVMVNGSFEYDYSDYEYAVADPKIFYGLITIIAIKWSFQGFFIFVKPFKVDASTFDKVLHVLLNTFVTIPFRDVQVEKQKSKSTEIFWNMIVNVSAFTAIISMAWILFANDTSIFTTECINSTDCIQYQIVGMELSFYKVVPDPVESPTGSVDIPLILVPFVLSLPLLLHLLSGFFLYVYYVKFHTWKELSEQKIRFCCGAHHCAWNSCNRDKTATGTTGDTTTQVTEAGLARPDETAMTPQTRTSTRENEAGDSIVEIPASQPEAGTTTEDKQTSPADGEISTAIETLNSMVQICNLPNSDEPSMLLKATLHQI